MGGLGVSSDDWGLLTAKSNTDEGSLFGLMHAQIESIPVLVAHPTHAPPAYRAEG
jgi:hypothetical protein